MLTLRPILRLLLAVSGATALLLSQNITEYVRVGGRVVAVEQSGSSTQVKSINMAVPQMFTMNLALDKSTPAITPQATISVKFSDAGGPDNISSGLTQFVPPNSDGRCSIGWLKPDPTRGTSGYIYVFGVSGLLNYSPSGAYTGTSSTTYAYLEKSNVCRVYPTSSFSQDSPGNSSSSLFTMNLDVRFLTQSEKYDVNISVFDQAGNQSPYQNFGTVDVVSTETVQSINMVSQGSFILNLALDNSVPAVTPQTTFSIKYSEYGGPDNISSGLTQFVPPNSDGRCSIGWLKPDPTRGTSGYIYVFGVSGLLNYSPSGAYTGTSSTTYAYLEKSNVCRVYPTSSFSQDSPGNSSSSLFTMNLDVRFLTQSEKYDVNVLVFDRAGNPSSYQSIGTVNVSAAVGGIAAGDISPINQFAQSGTFTFTATDTAGYAADTSAFVTLLFNTSWTESNACFIGVQPSSRLIYLADDSGNLFANSTQPGGTSVSNTRCTLNPAQVQISYSGQNLTVSGLTVGFTNKDAQQNNVFLREYDTNNLSYNSPSPQDTWYVYQGYWTRPNDIAPISPSTLTAVSGGQQQTFSANEAVSWTLQSGALGSLSGSPGTSVTYTAPSVLPSSAATDTLTASLPGLTSQTANITFNAQQGLSYLTPSPMNTYAPVGQRTQFTFGGTSSSVLTDPNVSFYLAFSPAYPIQSANSCNIQYLASSHSLLLMDDGGNNYFSTLSNSQCTVDSPTYSTSGRTMTITVFVSFKAGYAGINIYTAPSGQTFGVSHIYTDVYDNSNQTFFQYAGDWGTQLLVSASPSSATVGGGNTQTFAANQSVTWSLAGPGSISATSGVSTVYTAPASISTAQSATLTATAGTNNSTNASITIPQALASVTVSPTSARVLGGSTQTFTANQSVTWSLTGAGSISASTGTSTVYTAPASISTSQSATLTATAGTSTVSVSITVPQALSYLTPSPMNTYAPVGQRTQFTFGGTSSSALTDPNVSFYLAFSPAYPIQSTNSCNLQYLASSHSLLLMNDGGSYVSALSNSQCTVDSPSYLANGNTMTITVFVSFKSSYATINSYTDSSGHTYGVSYMFTNVFDNYNQTYFQYVGNWGTQ